MSESATEQYNRVLREVWGDPKFLAELEESRRRWAELERQHPALAMIRAVQADMTVSGRTVGESLKHLEDAEFAREDDGEWVRVR